MNKSLLAGIVVVAAALVLLASSAFIVQETEKVVITQFGEVVRMVEQPGLGFKMPFIQDVKRLDKRWLEWDGDPNQITTLDKRYIYIDVFARWRIDNPRMYIETLRDETSAQGRLDDIIDNATRNVVANHKLIEVIRSTNRSFEHDMVEDSSLTVRDEISAADEDPMAEVSVDAEKATPPATEEEEQDTSGSEENGDTAADEDVEEPSEDEDAAPDAEEADDAKESPESAAEVAEAKAEAKARATEAEAEKDSAPTKSRRRNLYAIEVGRDNLTRLVLEKASAKAKQLGIDIKDVQIKRIDYIETVQDKVFDRMISERQRVAESYRSEGQGRSAEIIGKMEMELQQIQSEAYRESQRIMGRADAVAAETYAKAYKKDPEFYQFTKTMESYKQTIDEESWLLLSTESDIGGHLKTMKGKGVGK